MARCILYLPYSKDDKYEVIDHLENENSGVDIMGEETLMNRLRTGASSPKSEKQFLVLTKPGIPSLNYFFTAKTVLVSYSSLYRN